MATNTGSTGIDSDRISELPDPILHHILGLLKTKQAVQTCVLSKRWERIWTFLSSLHFDHDDFYSNSHDAGLENSSKRLVRFVNMFVMRRESLDLNMFRLSGEEIYSDYFYDSDESIAEYGDYNDFSLEYEDDITEWIHYAVKYNTRVLHLLSLPANSLPCCIYTCTSLEELYLSDCQIDATGIINLPNLKKLSIHRAIGDYHSLGDIINSIISGCTILESLRLEDCSSREYLIAHECLKQLAILNDKLYGIDRTRLSVHAPKLLSFSYDGEAPLSSEETVNMPSLVSANLEISRFVMTEIAKKLAPLLSAITNVEVLNLKAECCWQV